MRIVLVCPSYYGYDVAIGSALKTLGHDVRTFGYFPHDSLADKIMNRLVEEVLPRLGVSGVRARRDAAFNTTVIDGARTARSELAIVVKGDLLTPETIESLAAICPLAHWAFDDPYRYPNVVATLPHYETVGSFSLNDTQRLVDDGLPAFYLPDGFDAMTFGVSPALRPPRRRFEVSFLGARYPERERLLQAVANAHVLGIWGGDWKRRPWRARYYQPRTSLDRCCQGNAGPIEADLIYRSSEVNLNVHGAWDGLNMRVFEIPGAGGFQLCDERNGLAEMFEPGHEIEVFATKDEMLAGIERALGDVVRRERIAAAGRRRAHAEHTLVHRMATLVAKVDV